MMNALVLACAVCGAGEDPTRGSLVTMSIIISLLPLAMLAGIIGFAVYKVRQAEKADPAPAAGQQEGN